MLSKLKKYQALDIHQLLNMVIKENEKTILDMNREQLWEHGAVDTTSPGKEFYSSYTIPLKKKFARYPKTDFITLRWDGDFYESLFLEIGTDEFTIKSDDPKWTLSLEPQTRFERALGLTNISKSQLRELVRDAIIRKIRNV